MKNLKEILLEEKGKDISATIYFDDFTNDFYNVVAEIFFQYNQNGNEPDEKDFDKAVKLFKEQFFIEPDEN